MVAAQYELLIDEGASFSQSFDLVVPETELPFDLTGYTARAEVRKSFQDDTLLIEFEIDIAEVDGTVTISASSEDTQGFAYPNMSEDQDCVLVGVWDLFITSGAGIVTRLLKGDVLLYPMVTHE